MCLTLATALASLRRPPPLPVPKTRRRWDYRCDIEVAVDLIETDQPHLAKGILRVLPDRIDDELEAAYDEGYGRAGHNRLQRALERWRVREPRTRPTRR